MKLSNLS